MLYPKKLETLVAEMRSMATTLVPYSYPRVSIEVDQEVVPLKIRNLNIDGYEVSLHFNKTSQYNGPFSDESLQLQSVNSMFLPFNLVCKLGIAFLGREQLAYTEFSKPDRKIYCWMVLYKDEEKIPPRKESTLTSYEDLHFHVLNSGSLNL